MGKGKKRKNPGVGVDFRKVKHKVGKKLPKAQNDTRTDFQARSINLPNQSITQDKSGAAVSERNLTLTELVAQLSHHNSGTRRDALVGLQQLASTHPTEARRQAALLLEALAGRLSDGEASVRAALLSTLRCAVLPALGPSGMRPFLALLLAHLTAALTHLSADVRFDALAVLQVLTQQAPQLLAQQQHMTAVLGHYNGLLSRANRGKSVRNQALTGLLRVVSSLDNFLQTAIGPSSSTGGQPAAAARGGGIGRSEGQGGRGGGEGLSVSGMGGTKLEGVLLMSLRIAAAPPAAAQLPDADCLLQLYCPAALAATATATSKSGVQKKQQQQPVVGVTYSAAGSSSSGTQLQQQVIELLTSLYDCWSEAAPGSLGTTPDTESAQVLVHILAATNLLLAHVIPQDTSAAAAAPAADPAMSTAYCHVSTHSSRSGQDWRGKGLGFDSCRDQKDWAEAASSIVLPKLTKVFPVAPEAPERLSPGVQDLLQAFNLLGMQLCSRLMAAGVNWPQQQQPPGRQQEQQQGGERLAASCVGDGILQDWQQQLLTFMAGALSAGDCLPSLHGDACTGVKLSPAISSSSKQQQQQQHTKIQGVAGGGISSSSSNSGLSSSSVMVTVLQSLQQLLPYLRRQHLQHILAAVSQVAAAAAPSQPSPVSQTSPASASVAGGAAAAAAAEGSVGDVYDGGALSRGAGSSSNSILMPLSAAARGAAASNAVRSAGLRLQLLLLQQHLAHAVPDALEEAAVLSWLAAAPRQLYQLGASKPKISQLLLQLLFEAARLSVPGSPIAEQLQGLTPQLAALLVTALPPDAPSNQQQQQQEAAATTTTPSRVQAAAAAAAAAASAPPPPAVRLVIGPISDLPVACQHLFFDTLAQLPQLTSHILKAVTLTCRVTSYSHAAVQRLLDGLLATAGSSMPPDLYASLLVTLLSPGPTGGYIHCRSRRQLQAGFDRHQLVVEAVCRWLHSYGPVRELLQLLTAPLLQQWQQQQHKVGMSATAAGARWTQQHQQQQVCCLATSLLALAALGTGCWQPSTCTAVRSTAARAPGAGPGVRTSHAATAHAAAISSPVGLLSVLPSVLVAYCLCCRGVTSTDAGGVEAALDSWLQQLVVPLGVALPLSTLLLPFLQELLQQGAQQQHQQLLPALVHVMGVLLGCQALRHGWVEHQQQLQGLLQQWEGWAQQVESHGGGGGGSAMTQLQQLQTSLAVMCSQ